MVLTLYFFPCLKYFLFLLEKALIQAICLCVIGSLNKTSSPEEFHTHFVSIFTDRFSFKFVCQKIAGSANIPSQLKNFSNKYELDPTKPSQDPNSTK